LKTASEARTSCRGFAFGFTGLPLDGRHANRFETGAWLEGEQRGLLDYELLLPPASSSRDVHRKDVGLKMPRSKAARTTAREPRPTPVMTFVAGVAFKTVLLS